MTTLKHLPRSLISVLNYANRATVGRVLPSLLTASLLGVSATANAGDFEQNPDFQLVRQTLIQQHGLTALEVDQALSEAHRLDWVVNLMNKPGESKEWYDYAPMFLRRATIQKGMRFADNYAHYLQDAEARYGVPQAVILGILGVETGYGSNQGKVSTLDALATLAFNYPRRADYFRNELGEFLLLCREQGWSPQSVMGSYAGALGFPQFMPSNIRKYALDFDHDGHIDFTRSPADSIGSIAHYLAEKGWQLDQPIGLRARFESSQGEDGNVRTSNDEAVIAKDLTQPIRYGVLSMKGLIPRTGYVDPAQPVNGIRLMGDSGPLYWITYPNFQVITTYNRSRMYAMAVWQLGTAVQNGDTDMQDLP